MTWSIRRAREADAPAMLAYFGKLVAEAASNILLDPAEANLTLEQELEFIRAHSGPRDILLIAESGGRVVATAGCKAKANLVNGHVAVLGISVDRDWRGRGLGRALMERLIDWGRATPGVTRVELEVFARNAVAIGLYERLGFVVEGRARNAFWRDGQYIDKLIMGLLFEDKAL